MSFTYSGLKTAIQEYCEYAGNEAFDANLDTFIKIAERSIWGFLQLPYFKQNSTAVLTASSAYFPLPEDFLAAFSLRLVSDPSGEVVAEPYLIEKDVNYIREVYPDSTTEGAPRFYALFDEATMLLGPTPDIAYLAELHYAHQPPSLTAQVDAGTTWLSENAPEALLYGSLREAYTFMKGDHELLNEYKERYVQALVNLKNLGEARDMKDIYRAGALVRKEA